MGVGECGLRIGISLKSIMVKKINKKRVRERERVENLIMQKMENKLNIRMEYTERMKNTQA